MSEAAPWFQAVAPRPAEETRYHVDERNAEHFLADALAQLVGGVSTSRDIVILCIGTDRSIGDALGPLVGSLLLEQGPWPYRVLGCLEEPVHAGNLEAVVGDLMRSGGRPFVIAVDACLGRAGSVGVISIGRGALSPGAGVNKRLPAVGDAHITGVVNVGGFMEYFVLQNTRLHLVMRMARLVAAAVGTALSGRGAMETLRSFPLAP